jgi:transcriptional regulator of acetoin/glycerol metabolism
MNEQDLLECGSKKAGATADPRIKTLDEIEKEHIMNVLEKCGGCKGEAAKLLGIDRKTLFRKLKSFASPQNP